MSEGCTAWALRQQRMSKMRTLYRIREKMFYQNKEQIKDLATTKLLWRGRRSGGTKGDEIEMFAIPEVVHNL
jgi:hypothetical protein